MDDWPKRSAGPCSSTTWGRVSPGTARVLFPCCALATTRLTQAGAASLSRRVRHGFIVPHRDRQAQWAAAPVREAKRPREPRFVLTAGVGRQNQAPVFFGGAADPGHEQPAWGRHGFLCRLMPDGRAGDREAASCLAGFGQDKSKARQLVFGPQPHRHALPRVPVRVPLRGGAERGRGADWRREAMTGSGVLAGGAAARTGHLRPSAAT